MLYAIILVVQLLVTVVMGLYFWRALRRSKAAESPAARWDSKAEMDKIRQMRTVRLNMPLNEQVRPRDFSAIIGQEAGIGALKAILCGPNPQHVILYGPPGVGKTCAARLVLEEAKKRSDSPFLKDAPFVEMDATCARFDERAIADPLIGSVHDPIYQGAGQLGMAGVPQPKPGAVTKAHGGVLFLDEIGELHPMQMNKLLKVLEDRKVMLESAYYSPGDRNVPGHIHDIFKNGLPADFRLVGATTRSPEEISPALRSRCMEVFFRPLTAAETARIAKNAAKAAGCAMEAGCADFIGAYSPGGRDAANLTQVAAGIALSKGRHEIRQGDVESVLRAGSYVKRPDKRLAGGMRVGRVHGLAVLGANLGQVLPIEAVAFEKSGERSGGSPEWKATGIVDTERLNAGSRTMVRRSTAAGALENVRSVLRQSGLPIDRFDLHIDFPGGLPVDGPSAGVAMAIAAYSALTKQPVSGSMAVTGELGLGGEVLPVGGVPAKVAAALEGGAQLVLVPCENYEESFASEPRIKPIARFAEALQLFLEEGAEEGCPAPHGFAAEAPFLAAEPN
ncbi:MAG: ATP-dependent protease LonB [Christensenellaceae bacterium]|jgi:Lon-like ATP-dependent protease|nr:ATP-dependent protease LonB [Christensenellaceae bacterium]